MNTNIVTLKGTSFFTREQFQILLQTQNELNEKFVPSYKEKISTRQYGIALFNEIAEFMESTPKFENHKFWKPYLDDDTQNCKIEAIDILHFGLSIILVKYDRLEDHFSTILFGESIETGAVEFFEIVGDLMISINSLSNSEIDRTSYSVEKLFLMSFKKLLSLMCQYLNMNFNDLYDGYFKKVKLNEKRIDGGYMEGKYEKVKNGVEDNRNLKV